MTVLDQECQCRVGLYSAGPSVRSRDVKSCAHCTTYCNSVNQQRFKGMDLNEVHQEDSNVATSVSRCQTMFVNICHFVKIIYFIYLL